MLSCLANGTSIRCCSHSCSTTMRRARIYPWTRMPRSHALSRSHTQPPVLGGLHHQYVRTNLRQALRLHRPLAARRLPDQGRRAASPRRTNFSIAYWTRSDNLRFVVVLTAGTNVGDDSRTLDEGGRITWRGFITLLSRRDPSPLLRKNFHHDLCGCLGAESSSISPRSNRFLIKCTPLPMNSFNTSRPCSAP